MGGVGRASWVWKGWEDLRIDKVVERKQHPKDQMARSCYNKLQT